MTARHHYTLVCDATGCKERFNIEVNRADQTRASAARDGWVHGIETPNVHRNGTPGSGPQRSLDYCPQHAHMLGELQPKTLPAHAVPEEIR